MRLVTEIKQEFLPWYLAQIAFLLGEQCGWISLTPNAGSLSLELHFLWLAEAGASSNGRKQTKHTWPRMASTGRTLRSDHKMAYLLSQK